MRQRIAVVDDNGDNRLLLSAVLRSLYDIDEYADGPTALAAMQETAPDLILLDISMPIMDGPAVLKRIREDASLKGLPVVALTAHAMSGDKERFLGLGFDGYISKPIIDWDALTSLLGDLMG